MDRLSQGIQVADGDETDILIHHLLGLVLEVFLEQLQEGADFRLRAEPVFHGKGIEGEIANPDPSTGLYRRLHGICALSVSQDPPHGMPLGPAAVAVHDDCNMLRKSCRIDFFHCQHA